MPALLDHLKNSVNKLGHKILDWQPLADEEFFALFSGHCSCCNDNFMLSYKGYENIDTIIILTLTGSIYAQFQKSVEFQTVCDEVWKQAKRNHVELVCSRYKTFL